MTPRLPSIRKISLFDTSQRARIEWVNRHSDEACVVSQYFLSFVSPYFESKSLFYNSVCYPTVLFVIHCIERKDQACLSKIILLCPLYNAVQATRTIGKFRLNLFYKIECYVCYYDINTFYLYTPY